MMPQLKPGNEILQSSTCCVKKEQHAHAITSPQELLSLMKPYKDAFIGLYWIEKNMFETSYHISKCAIWKTTWKKSSGDSWTGNLALLAVNTAPGLWQNHQCLCIFKWQIYIFCRGLMVSLLLFSFFILLLLVVERQFPRVCLCR